MLGKLRYRRLQGRVVELKCAHRNIHRDPRTLGEGKGKESALKLGVLYEEDITAELQVLKIL